MGSTFRLVIFRGAVSRYRAAVQGALYAPDATPFSQPLWTFELAPDQELPAVDSGSLVEVTGAVESGSRPSVNCGGMVVVLRSGLRPGVGPGAARIYAQHGDVMVCPGVAGWNDARRYVRPASLTSVAEVHEAFARWVRWDLVVGGAGAALAALAAVGWSTRSRVGLLAVCGFGVLAALGLGGAVRVRRDAVRYRAWLAAREGSERPMVMRLGWLAGGVNQGLKCLNGPVAEARLTDPHDDGSSSPVRVRVLNVTPEIVDEGPAAVRAVLNAAGSICAIHVGAHQLCPTPVLRSRLDDTLAPYG